MRKLKQSLLSIFLSGLLISCTHDSLDKDELNLMTNGKLSYVISYESLPIELTLAEKLSIAQKPELINSIINKSLLAIPDAPNWDCLSHCWRKYSNCWNGLSYYDQGSEKWIMELDKCFSDAAKCEKKCEKEKF